MIATKLTALMASRHGTLGTAAAVQRCFALLLKDPADPFSCAHNVANCLLQLCRQRLLTLAAGRSSRSANAFTLGPASDALQEAQAAMQVLAMLAAERPMLLAGTAKQILASAFPHRSKLDLGLELLQKWALDAVVAMARDVSTAPEVLFRMFPHSLPVAQFTHRQCFPQPHTGQDHFATVMSRQL